MACWRWGSHRLHGVQRSQAQWGTKGISQPEHVSGNDGDGLWLDWMILVVFSNHTVSDSVIFWVNRTDSGKVKFCEFFPIPQIVEMVNRETFCLDVFKVFVLAQSLASRPPLVSVRNKNL